jgi:hypothetical protein
MRYYCAPTEQQMGREGRLRHYGAPERIEQRLESESPIGL